ncbi:glycosyltransferase [Longimicrobium sp.]|jgi:glycosyltransferase involved in cell wall biosynthesis|uniref:glycosyltransferase n=1 Tax=Longimicrobium sp. TaxID=2029185 RepID=UPI002ED9E017
MYVIAHNASAVLGGGEIWTALLLAGLRDRGHRVLMLCRNDELAARIGAYGIPTGVQPIGGDVMLPDALRLAARLRRERPDAVLLTTFKKLLLAGMATRIAGVPFVVQRIGLEGDTPARSARYRFALRRFVHRVALNAHGMRRGFLAGDPRLDPSRVITLLDGVRAPVRQAPAGTVRRELGIPAEAVVVGAVGRLASQKRFDRLLRALAGVPQPVHCVIAGAGPQRARLEALARELGMRDRLHLLGFRADVGDVLDALDLFVVSSDREGLANAMLEAMAFGLPVVSTEVSGAREALEPDAGEPRPGIVVPVEEDALRDALAELVRDGDARRAMGVAARKRAERLFGWERFLDDWERLLASGGG